MSKKVNSQSDYDQCNTLLLSAYFCVMGRSTFDQNLRKSIEEALTILLKEKDKRTTSNVIPFCRELSQRQLTDR